MLISLHLYILHHPSDNLYYIPKMYILELPMYLHSIHNLMSLYILHLHRILLALYMLMSSHLYILMHLSDNLYYIPQMYILELPIHLHSIHNLMSLCILHVYRILLALYMLMSSHLYILHHPSDNLCYIPQMYTLELPIYLSSIHNLMSLCILHVYRILLALYMLMSSHLYRCLHLDDIILDKNYPT